MLLGKNVSQRVEAEAAARMDGDGRRLVDHQQLVSVGDDTQRLAAHWHLVSEYTDKKTMVVFCVFARLISGKHSNLESFRASCFNKQDHNLCD